MGRRVVLTGATGLIGPDILNRLVEEQFEVTCLARRCPPWSLPHVTWVEADLSESSAHILEQLPAVDHVVHAAAVRTARTDDELARMRRVNVNFCEALFDWAASRRLDGVIFISGFNLLRRPLEPVIDEGHPVSPATPYAETKHRGEQALARHAAARHFRGVCLRVSSPVPFAYDRLHETVVKKWIDLARRREPIVVSGQGERTQDFVATPDMAAAVVRAIESPEACGTYNVASGTALSMLHLARLIAAKWDTPVAFEGADASEGERWNISIDKARRELGYQPRDSAREAIQRLLAML